MKNAIKAKREMLGLTQNELAKVVGVTQGAVAQWENGISRPGVDTLCKLADVFRCKVDDILNPT